MDQWRIFAIPGCQFMTSSPGPMRPYIMGNHQSVAPVRVQGKAQARVGCERQQRQIRFSQRHTLECNTKYSADSDVSRSCKFEYSAVTEQRLNSDRRVACCRVSTLPGRTSLPCHHARHARMSVTRAGDMGTIEKLPGTTLGSPGFTVQRAGGQGRRCAWPHHGGVAGVRRPGSST